MSEKQKLHNDEQFIKFPIGLMDAILQAKLSGGEVSIVLYIVRMTYGWKRTKAWISKSAIAKKTGMTRQSIIRAVKRLEEKGVIEQKDGGKFGTQVMRLRAPSAWKGVYSSTQCVLQYTGCDSQSTQDGVYQSTHQPVTQSTQGGVYSGLHNIDIPNIDSHTKKPSTDNLKDRASPSSFFGDDSGMIDGGFDYDEDDEMTEEEWADLEEEIRRWKEARDAEENL